KRRPPSPHSDSNVRSPLRQRAAKKPSTVTKTKSAMKTPSATGSSCVIVLLPAFGEIDDEKDERGQRHPQKLIPVEEGNARKIRLRAVVERHPQGRHEGHDQKKMDQPKPAFFSAVHIPCVSPAAFHLQTITA